ncbi:hypothetical protein [Stenoxybacter acetivorans]|nr:hypothetical protein [Stenoxybacter acetivorans]
MGLLFIPLFTVQCVAQRIDASARCVTSAAAYFVNGFVVQPYMPI